MHMLGRTAIAAGLTIAICAVLAPSLQKASILDAVRDTPNAAVETDSKPEMPADTSAIAAVPSQPSYGFEAIIPRDADGHFRANVRINGADMQMMVDSGASVVVLGEAQARAAGITVDPSAFTGSAQTAGGTVATMPVVIERISIGGIERSNVQAAVIRGDLPQPLLGQSFLATISSVSVEGDRMRLR
jgi:aspartyl protease family protein